MNSNMRIDIHGMYKTDAMFLLEDVINDIPEDETAEIEVVHGYRSGKVLMNMVRKELKHPRIKRRMVSMNQGITILVIE